MSSVYCTITPLVLEHTCSYSLISQRRIQCIFSAAIASLYSKVFCRSASYPSLLGLQRQHGMRSLPNASYTCQAVGIEPQTFWFWVYPLHSVTRPYTPDYQKNFSFHAAPVYLAVINQSINQFLFLIKRYIINALSTVQWNTHISLNTYIYIYSEIQHTYKHSYKAAISAHVRCFYFRHTHSHTRGRCERPAPSLFLVIHL